MATIQDVAAKSGVSVATVSRVLNGSPRVSPEARDRVRAAIEALGYHPNLLGRNLRRTESRMLLVVAASIENPFYAGVVQGIEAAAHREGYNALLCNTDRDLDREAIYLGMLDQRLADGAVLLSPQLDARAMERLDARHPLVQCCEYLDGAAVPHVTVDNRAAARDAVRYLAGLGHRRIGMIMARTQYAATRVRLDGYRDALDEAGIAHDPALVAYGGFDFENGRTAAVALLARPPAQRPTALFCVSDLVAAGAIRAAREAGLSVPADVSVVGFDDIEYATMGEPRLTTVAQPRPDLGRVAVEVLLRRLRAGAEGRSDGTAEPESIDLPHALRIRESTAPPRNAGPREGTP